MQNPGQYIIIIALLVLVIVKRIMRAFSYQPYKKGTLVFRITLYSFIALLLMWYAALDPVQYLFDLGGLALGAGLAYLAVKNMMFESRKDGLFFKTHVWVEIVILAVFFIRLAWRYYIVYNEYAGLAPEVISRKLRYSSDPFTGVVFFLLCTYYIGYYAFVYRRGKEKLAVLETAEKQ